MARYEVTKREWDHNGSFHVEVRDNESAFATDKTVRAARDVARRADTMGLTQWTRHDGRYLDGDLKMVYRFTVSRLDRQYR